MTLSMGAILISFLSTLSLRRATWPGLLARPFFIISIHALLAESDSWPRGMIPLSLYFYPRSPCGERLHYDNYNLHCVEISIHALLAESDQARKTEVPGAMYFYPRSPCGERHASKDAIKAIANFYPRSPCGERRHL